MSGLKTVESRDKESRLVREYGIRKNVNTNITDEKIFKQLSTELGKCTTQVYREAGLSKGTTWGHLWKLTCLGLVIHHLSWNGHDLWKRNRGVYGRRNK